MGMILVAINAFAFNITGDISGWQKDDFISFDEVGDCTASCGDITSVFSRVEDETLFMRITFDDMVEREHNLVVKDNFQNKNIFAYVRLFAGEEKKVIFQKTFPLQSLMQKDGDEKILRTVKITFTLTQTAMVDVAIYDVKGALVKSFDTQHVTADDEVSLQWNGKDELGKTLSNSIYFYSVKVNGQDYATKQVILMR